MTVTDEMVLAGALAVRKRRMELNGIGHEFDPAIPPSDEQLDLTHCALTAALSDQVVVPKDEYDSLMKRDAAMAQVLTLARELGEVTRRLETAWKENRKLVRQNKKLSAAPPPSSTAGESR